VPTETIPPELLRTLLHEFFADERTRISKGADKAVGKYMETFVREAIARANYERNGNGAGGAGDGFLEVCVRSRTRQRDGDGEVGEDGSEEAEEMNNVRWQWLILDYRLRIWRSWRRNLSLIFERTRGL
jgi:hypothetical protein